MSRHPADQGSSSWSRHGDARQLLSLQHPHARASSHLLWSGSDTEEEEGRSIKYLIASTDGSMGGWADGIGILAKKAPNDLI